MAVALADTLSGRPLSRRPLTPDQASYRFWVSFVLFLLAFGFGARWDAAWHTQNPFEDFYSPPHLFIYSTFALGALTFLSLTLSPERRTWFGSSLRLPVITFEVPATLALTLAGMGTVMLAGMLDMLWHNTFGLDETAWSTPHAMIGYGILLTWWGFLAGRLALRRHIPISRPFAVVAGLLSLILCVNILLGPLDNNQTEAVVRGVGSVPVLAATAAFQHTVRISEKYDLTFGNPVFVPLSAAVTGLGLSFVWSLFPLTEDRALPLPGRRWNMLLRPFITLLRAFLSAMRWLSRGKRGFLLVALLATFFAWSGAHNRAEYLDARAGTDLLSDPRNFLPLPYIVAALTYTACKGLGRSERFAWGAAGLLFATLVASWWGHPAWLVLLAVPAMIAGAALGARVLAALEDLDRGRVRVILAAALTLPFLTGAIDLMMRGTTP